MAQVFKELGFIEKYGDGVKRVIQDLETYGLIEPTFEEKAGGFYVVVYDKKNTMGTTQEIQYDTTQETTPYVSNHIAYQRKNNVWGTTQEKRRKTTQEKGTAQEILRLIKKIPVYPEGKWLNYWASQKAVSNTTWIY